MVLPDFASQIAQIVKKKQDNIIYVGNLTAERDFLDVRDVVRAYYLLSKGAFKGKIFNVCSGTPVKIITILEKLIEYSNLNIQIKEDPLKLRPVDVKKYYGSNEKLLKETGWKPEIAFDKTIKDTLDYWIENTY
jgi:GDP-4-dehydro-6-deoxy-D-mannose reductase